MPFNTKNHEYDPFVGSNVLQVYYFFFHKFNKLKALNDHNLYKNLLVILGMFTKFSTDRSANAP